MTDIEDIKETYELVQSVLFPGYISSDAPEIVERKDGDYLRVTREDTNPNTLSTISDEVSEKNSYRVSDTTVEIQYKTNCCTPSELQHDFFTKSISTDSYKFPCPSCKNNSLRKIYPTRTKETVACKNCPYITSISSQDLYSLFSQHIPITDIPEFQTQIVNTLNKSGKRPSQYSELTKLYSDTEICLYEVSDVSLFSDFSEESLLVYFPPHPYLFFSFSDVLGNELSLEMIDGFCRSCGSDNSIKNKKSVKTHAPKFPAFLDDSIEIHHDPFSRMCDECVTSIRTNAQEKIQKNVPNSRIVSSII